MTLIAGRPAFDIAIHHSADTLAAVEPTIQV
jgi:hypothetical protein